VSAERVMMVLLGEKFQARILRESVPTGTACL